MTTQPVFLKVQETKVEQFLNFIQDLGYVEIVDDEPNTNDIKRDILEGFKEIQQIQNGKIKPQSIESLLDEL